MGKNKYAPLFVVFIALIFISFYSFAASVTQQKKLDQLKQLDQLDQLDHLDFIEHNEMANNCIRQHDFSCAEKKIAEAGRFVGNSQDKSTLRSTQQNLITEKQRVAEEIRQREAEARRREEEEERQAKLEEEREERRERQRRQEEKEEREAQNERDRAESYRALNDHISQTFAQNAQLLSNIDRQTNAAYAESRRVQASQAAERKREREEAEERAEKRRRDDERDRNARIARVDAQRERDQRVEKEREREQEQKRQREAAAAAAKQAKEQEQARMQEERRQQEARAEADRRAEQKRKTDYLVALKQGIRLRATKCMGGEGKYYVTGSKPNIKNGVPCIDVFFQASCPGSAASSRGVLGNFIGMSGCLGDLKEIDPKPGCPVEQVLLEVTDVQATCNHGW